MTHFNFFEDQNTMMFFPGKMTTVGGTDGQFIQVKNKKQFVDLFVDYYKNNGFTGEVTFEKQNTDNGMTLVYAKTKDHKCSWVWLVAVMGDVLWLTYGWWHRGTLSLRKNDQGDVEFPWYFDDYMKIGSSNYEKEKELMKYKK